MHIEKKSFQNASRNHYKGVVPSKLITTVINVAYKYNMKLDDIKLYKVVFSLSVCRPIKRTALSQFYFYNICSLSLFLLLYFKLLG